MNCSDYRKLSKRFNGFISTIHPIFTAHNHSQLINHKKYISHLVLNLLYGIFRYHSHYIHLIQSQMDIFIFNTSNIKITSGEILKEEWKHKEEESERERLKAVAMNTQWIFLNFFLCYNIRLQGISHFLFVLTLAYLSMCLCMCATKNAKLYTPTKA